MDVAVAKGFEISDTGNQVAIVVVSKYFGNYLINLECFFWVFYIAGYCWIRSVSFDKVRLYLQY